MQYENTRIYDRSIELLQLAHEVLQELPHGRCGGVGVAGCDGSADLAVELEDHRDHLRVGEELTGQQHVDRLERVEEHRIERVVAGHRQLVVKGEVERFDPLGVAGVDALLFGQHLRERLELRGGSVIRGLAGGLCFDEQAHLQQAVEEVRLQRALVKAQQRVEQRQRAGLDENELDAANNRLSKLYRVPRLRHQRKQ